MRLLLMIVFAFWLGGCDGDQRPQNSSHSDDLPIQRIIHQNPLVEDKNRIAVLNLNRLLVSYKGAIQVRAEVGEILLQSDSKEKNLDARRQSLTAEKMKPLYAEIKREIKAMQDSEQFHIVLRKDAEDASSYPDITDRALNALNAGYIQFLLTTVNSLNKDEARLAITRLGALGPEAAASVPTLLQILKRSEELSALQRPAARALGRIRRDTPDVSGACQEFVKAIRRKDSIQGMLAKTNTVDEEYIRHRLGNETIKSVKGEGTKEMVFVRIGFEPDPEWPDNGLYLKFTEEEGVPKIQNAEFSLNQINF